MLAELVECGGSTLMRGGLDFCPTFEKYSSPTLSRWFRTVYDFKLNIIPGLMTTGTFYSRWKLHNYIWTMWLHHHNTTAVQHKTKENMNSHFVGCFLLFFINLPSLATNTALLPFLFNCSCLNSFWVFPQHARTLTAAQLMFANNFIAECTGQLFFLNVLFECIWVQLKGRQFTKLLSMVEIPLPYFNYAIGADINNPIKVLTVLFEILCILAHTT